MHTKVYGLGLRIYDVRLGVLGLVLRVYRVQMAWSFGFRAYCLGSRVGLLGRSSGGYNKVWKRWWKTRCHLGFKV